ncbi:hypothetical protein M9978_08145 [Sphingomonas sp. MG17]|uniref:Uncharacterized protein n=1 Tax=Sphingomonas tagetis TaxID=2949092 RepID=A0A9X2HN48_9SPHN|nr:hypothetical protein [Sphingomonas tagetis]MCP3730398.1 hypothetical protein [Sphingomonas tagetis]
MSEPPKRRDAVHIATIPAGTTIMRTGPTTLIAVHPDKPPQTIDMVIGSVSDIEFPDTLPEA